MSEQDEENGIIPEDAKLEIHISEDAARTIPRTWLGFLSDYCAENLRKYLEDRGEPSEIIDMVEALHALAWMQEQDMPNAEELLGTVNLQIARGLHYLKAELSTPAGTMTA